MFNKLPGCKIFSLSDIHFCHTTPTSQQCFSYSIFAVRVSCVDSDDWNSMWVWDDSWSTKMHPPTHLSSILSLLYLVKSLPLIELMKWSTDTSCPGNRLPDLSTNLNTTLHSLINLMAFPMEDLAVSFPNIHAAHFSKFFTYLLLYVGFYPLSIWFRTLVQGRFFIVWKFKCPKHWFHISSFF